LEDNEKHCIENAVPFIDVGYVLFLPGKAPCFALPENFGRMNLNFYRYDDHD
jgi:hypothetical protein